MSRRESAIHQVVSIVKVNKDARISLRKAAQQYFALNGRRLLDLGTKPEILLSAGKGKMPGTGYRKW